MDNDNFISRVQTQIKIGTRHHHEDDINRAYKEYSDLSILRTTEPDETDKAWWQLRAGILARDGDIRRPATMWQRRN